jgi:hypothetical protein
MHRANHDVVDLNGNGASFRNTFMLKWVLRKIKEIQLALNANIP